MAWNKNSIKEYIDKTQYELINFKIFDELNSIILIKCKKCGEVYEIKFNNFKRKKDKNGNMFAYIDLYTTSGIIEGTIWSSQLKQYSNLIEKGKCLAMLGRKSENHFFVKDVKDYNVWLEEIKEIKGE